MTDTSSTRDELDIHRVIADYAWACDNADWALLKSVFSEDATLDYSSTGGPAGGATRSSAGSRSRSPRSR